MYPVPAENIYAVSNPKNFHFGKDTASRKAAVVVDRLNWMQERMAKARRDGTLFGAPVVNAAGNGMEIVGIFGFSDDDPAFIQKVSEVVQEGMLKGFWPDLKIRIIYTGKETPELKPGSFVITPHGRRRSLLGIEKSEAKVIVPRLVWDYNQRLGCFEATMSASTK